MALTNIILSEKKWNEELVSLLAIQYKHSKWKLINNKSNIVSQSNENEPHVLKEYLLKVNITVCVLVLNDN